MKKLAEAFYGRARAYDRTSRGAATRRPSPRRCGRNVGAPEAPFHAWRVMRLQPTATAVRRDLDTILSRGFPFPPPARFAGEGTS